MVKFKCKDTGIHDMMKCDFEVNGVSSKDEMMKIIIVHLKETHKIETIPQDMAAKIEKAIKT